MNKTSISPMSNDVFGEYPEISQTDLERAIHRRNFVEVSKKQNINLALDSDIIAWLKKKSGESGYQSLINATLRNVITHEIDSLPGSPP
jgi:uncharacterized protein (DUF4415 family)